jgi:DNA-binding transcriptional ArsR family regulator
VFDRECPVCRTAEIISGKWTLLIIRDLADDSLRFCELERSLEGISPRTLSLRLRALEDQGVAGAVMMIEGSIVTLVALAWLFLRMASEGELRQSLLERGLDPRTVKRAVRYGRAEELSRPR